MSNLMLIYTGNWSMFEPVDFPRCPSGLGSQRSIRVAQLFMSDWTISCSVHLWCSMFGFLSFLPGRFIQFSFPYAGGYNCTCRWQLPPFQPFPLATVLSVLHGSDLAPLQLHGRWRMEAPFIFQPHHHHHHELQVNTISVWCPAGWHKLWGILATNILSSNMSYCISSTYLSQSVGQLVRH